MADGSIEKKRYEILHWDAARLGEELSELPSSLYFVSIDAEENLREDLQNENSFVSVMVRRLGLALELHPDYAQKPIDDLRKLFYTNDGFFVCPCVQKFEPSEFEPCKNCNINYFCWSCVYPMYKIDEIFYLLYPIRKKHYGKKM